VREKAALYGLFQNLQSAALISLALMFVVGLGLAWQGRLAAELLAWSTFAVVSLVWLWRSRQLRFSFDRPYARDLAGFGVPLIPHLLGAILMVQVDRLLLTNLVGVDETGLYTVGYQLALVIELFAVSFNNAYAPWLYRRLTDADDGVKRRLVRFTYVGFAVMLVLALAVATAMPWLAGHLLDPRYAESARFVPWLAVGFLFSGMYYLVANYIFYAQRTGWLAAVTMMTALINIPLTYALIKLNGGLGAAQAMAISFGLSFLLTWVVSQRVYPMPWLDHRMISSEPKESDQ
jgi:O-antigen/teichoic acid export membrane protein